MDSLERVIRGSVVHIAGICPTGLELPHRSTDQLVKVCGSSGHGLVPHLAALLQLHNQDKRQDGRWCPAAASTIVLVGIGKLECSAACGLISVAFHTNFAALKMEKYTHIRALFSPLLTTSPLNQAKAGVYRCLPEIQGEPYSLPHRCG